MLMMFSSICWQFKIQRFTNKTHVGRIWMWFSFFLITAVHRSFVSLSKCFLQRMSSIKSRRPCRNPLCMVPLWSSLQCSDYSQISTASVTCSNTEPADLRRAAQHCTAARGGKGQTRRNSICDGNGWRQRKVWSETLQSSAAGCRSWRELLWWLLQKTQRKQLVLNEKGGGFCLYIKCHWENGIQVLWGRTRWGFLSNLIMRTTCEHD